MNLIVRTLWAAGACLLFASEAPALSVIPPSFEELVQKADVVVQTEVLSTRAEWTGSGENRHIVTKVKVRVDDCLVGEAPEEIELSFFGGAVGDEGMLIEGMPTFAKGDHDILFVRNNGKSFCPLVNAGHGRYLVVKSEKTSSSFVARSDGTPLRKTSDVSTALNEHSTLAAKVDESAFMSLESFKAAVIETARLEGKTAKQVSK